MIARPPRRPGSRGAASSVRVDGRGRTALVALALTCHALTVAAGEEAPVLDTDAVRAEAPGNARDARAARAIAFDPDRGNCLACHVITDGSPAGNVGPALTGVAGRFVSPAALYAFLWDARASRPWAMMPPYGRNGILSAREIALLTEWLWTL